MDDLGATVLVCTPSYALHLADVARERGVDLHRLGVRTTIHAGEPGAGIAAVRHRIEEAWNAKCYDHAGMTEVGPHSFECIQQNGLHVIESEFIAEVLDPATGRHVGEGEVGELILTNLGRTGSPIFRYRTGDRVRWSTAPCGCGRTFARLPGGILARMDDMLIVRGINVFPSALEAVVRQFPVIDEFQIEAYKRGELDEIRLHLEVDGPSPEGVLRSVVEAVRLAVGIRVEAVAVPPKSLPRYELKAKRVVRRPEVS
jgi:phenylacetate-CoA ligase